MTEATLASEPAQRRGQVSARRRGALAINPLVVLWHTMIGKKVVMAATGAVLVGFVIAHMLGNLKVFSGANEINAYSLFLREVGSPAFAYGELLWLVRMVLLTCLALHITAAVQLKRLNRNARPIGYDTKKAIETTVSARTMGWGGVILVFFVTFHLLHFSAGVVGFQPGQFKHLDVYQNVVSGFSVRSVTLFYIVAMVALCLHLDHGIASVFQTLGWNTAQNTRTLKTISRAIALVVFAGFVSVPVSVLAGWLR
jgi:succinate dehydrogenase / fumarate reductase cytochrome b subunit